MFVAPNVPATCLLRLRKIFLFHILFKTQTDTRDLRLWNTNVRHPSLKQCKVSIAFFPLIYETLQPRRARGLAATCRPPPPLPPHHP